MIVLNVITQISIKWMKINKLNPLASSRILGGLLYASLVENKLSLKKCTFYEFFPVR